MLTCTFICNPSYTCNVLLSTRGIGDTTRDHVGPWQEIEFQLMFESDYGWIGCVISHPSGSRSRTFLRTFCRKGTEPIQADPTTQGWALISLDRRAAKPPAVTSQSLACLPFCTAMWTGRQSQSKGSQLSGGSGSGSNLSHDLRVAEDTDARNLMEKP